MEYTALPPSGMASVHVWSSLSLFMMISWNTKEDFKVHHRLHENCILRKSKLSQFRKLVLVKLVKNTETFLKTSVY